MVVAADPEHARAAVHEADGRGQAGAPADRRLVVARRRVAVGVAEGRHGEQGRVGGAGRRGVLQAAGHRDRRRRDRGRRRGGGRAARRVRDRHLDKVDGRMQVDMVAADGVAAVGRVDPALARLAVAPVDRRAVIRRLAVQVGVGERRHGERLVPRALLLGDGVRLDGQRGVADGPIEGLRRRGAAAVVHGHGDGVGVGRDRILGRRTGDDAQVRVDGQPVRQARRAEGQRVLVGGIAGRQGEGRLGPGDGRLIAGGGQRRGDVLDGVDRPGEFLGVHVLGAVGGRNGHVIRPGRGVADGDGAADEAGVRVDGHAGGEAGRGEGRRGAGVIDRRLDRDGRAFEVGAVGQGRRGHVPVEGRASAVQAVRRRHRDGAGHVRLADGRERAADDSGGRVDAQALRQAGGAVRRRHVRGVHGRDWQAHQVAGRVGLVAGVRDADVVHRPRERLAGGFRAVGHGHGHVVGRVAGGVVLERAGDDAADGSMLRPSGRPVAL